MIQFQEIAWTNGKEDRKTEEWMEGQKDRQTLFHRILPATGGGPKIKERKKI